MKQAWYWLTAGVMAMGLNGMYHDGGAEWVHRIVNRSAAVAALASGHSERFLASAQLFSGREQAACRVATAVARFQAKMAQPQSGLAHFDVMTAQQEAQLARMEANRARFEAGKARLDAQVARLELVSDSFGPEFAEVFRAEQIKTPVMCPRVRVSVPRTFVRVRVPKVRVETLSEGPI